MKGVQELLSFNRGIISRLGMARVDLKRTALSAAIMNNWMPRVLGSMMLRAGLGYLGSTRANSAAKSIPFIFAVDDTAIIEATDDSLRFWVDDEVVTRSAVTASITNGTFAIDLTGWTDADEAGAASTYGAGGYMALTGTGTNSAIRYQLVTVVESGTQHSLRILVERGNVVLRIGSTIGGAEFLSDVNLGAGDHSITFTPNANFYIQFSAISESTAQIDTVSFDAGGALVLTAPWAEADLPNLRWTQSGDVVYVACDGVAPHKIERRANDSWSCVKYLPIDGPFLLDNTSRTTLSVSALTGATLLTSTNNVFKSTNVGSLFMLRSVGQDVTSVLGSANTFTNSIRVTGVGETRRFGIVISDTFTATLTLQYSVDDVTWLDRTTYTAPTSTSLLDGLDNQIIYYRIGIKTGDYTSGSATASLNYSSGSITGTARVTGFTNETSVTATVQIAMGSTDPTADWAEGAWSERRGYPSSVALHDGRLIWSGKDRFWGSVTDQFETFDPDFEGDAGPISRSIGFGPVDKVRWLVSLNRLLAGTDGTVIEARSSSLDEPLTPTNFTPKTAATRGSAAVDAVKIDNTAAFVQRSGLRVFEIDNNAGTSGGVLSTLTDLTMMAPEVCNPGIVCMAVQREPDTRLHCVLSDGTVAVLVWDRAENVICWVTLDTDGEVEDVVTLPGAEEDAVYYVVNRTIGGVTKRYYERFAMESECRGGAINKLADSFVYAAGASNVITGLDHLEGETVVAWGGGIDLGTFTVSGGSITLHASTTYTNRCAGLGYQARFKSTKLAYSMQGRSGLTLKKKIDHLGLVMVDTHPQGLSFGRSFDSLDPLPQTDRYGAVDLDAVWDEYDSEAHLFNGTWDTDSRLCLVANAPLACTVLAAVVEMETNAR
jgi:hypothetical protein